MHINDLLKIASERKASDLHLKVGSHPVLRINGELLPLVETKRLMYTDAKAWFAAETYSVETISLGNSAKKDRARADLDKQKAKAQYEIDLPEEKGKKYSYICTVPGHAAAGMKGTFKAT